MATSQNGLQKLNLYLKINSSWMELIKLNHFNAISLLKYYHDIALYYKGDLI